LSKDIELEEDAYSRLKKRLVDVGDEYLYQLGSWDPEAEICDNNIDDDNDNRPDCEDPDCAEQLSCRPEKSRQLTVFVMSQCPYGVKVLDAMEEVLANFNRDRSKIDFRVEFVGTVSDGELSSMHGDDEVAEDLRQICAQRYYGHRYQFMDYILCRNDNIRSQEWEDCARGGISADVIRRCAEGPEGQMLLRESFERAKALGFRGSPTWLLNNRYEMGGRDPETIKNEFCAQNELPECSRRLSTGT
jgi:glutaredoxin